MLIEEEVYGTIFIVNLAGEITNKHNDYSGMFVTKCGYCNHKFIRKGRSTEAKCPKCGKYFCVPDPHEHPLFKRDSDNTENYKCPYSLPQYQIDAIEKRRNERIKLQKLGVYKRNKFW